MRRESANVVVLPLRHTRRGSGQPSGGCRMGGGSDFWELIGRKCKSAEDANNEDTLCTAPSDDPGASSAWAQRVAPACFRRDQSLITRRVTNMQCNRRMRRPRLCRSQQQVLHEYG